MNDPLAFAVSPGEGVTSSVDFIRHALADPQQAIFAVFPEHKAAPPAAVSGSDSPVGIVGIRREPNRKSAHRATVWGLWVAPEHRGRGLGRALMEEALRFARALDGVEYVSLAVGDWNADAKRLYLDLGFTSWGIERDAFRVGDDVVNDHHMSLRLR